MEFVCVHVRDSKQAECQCPVPALRLITNASFLRVCGSRAQGTENPCTFASCPSGRKRRRRTQLSGGMDISVHPIPSSQGHGAVTTAVEASRSRTFLRK